MKKLFILLLIIFLAVGASYYYFYYKDSPQKFSITSPLPNLLTKVLPQARGVENAWNPNPKVLGSSIKKPDIVASSIAAYDLTTNQYLISQDVGKRLPIASLTKIMTATIALENMELNQDVKIGQKAATIGEDSMGLTHGEKLTLHDLLYGLMLNSGNDAAEAIAAASPFGRDNFVYLMNKKAEELGLSDTHFTNPTGLQGDGNQYSTAKDLIVMTRYALQNPTFAEIVSTYEHDIAQTNEHKAYTIYNETNLLTSYPGVKGVKTGFTDESGYSLVTYLEYDSHKIIAILLNASDRRQEMKDLLDYSLKSEGIKPPPHD